MGMWLDLSKEAVCEDIHSQEMCTRGLPLQVRLSIARGTRGPILQMSVNLSPQLSGLMNKVSVTAGVLVCLGCHNRLGGLNNRIYYTQFWRVGSPRSSCPRGLMLVTALVLVHSPHLLPVSSHGVMGKGTLWGLLIRALIPLMRAPPS